LEVLLLMFASADATEISARPMIPAFFTGERLYEICAGPNEGQCWMYVAGVIDGVFEAEADASKPSICRSEITNRDAAERVTHFLRENEAIRHKAAAVAVKLALQAELACKAEEA
jgi:hypothetical protein